MMKAIISHNINQILDTVKYKCREGNQLDTTEYFIVLMLNMFRAITRPSSGARDYTCVIATYGV